MIIARSANKNDPAKQLIILGITQGNLIRLTEGQALLIRRETHGEGVPPDMDIMIIYGTTTEDLLNKMRPAIGEETRVYAMDRKPLP